MLGDESIKNRLGGMFHRLFGRDSLAVLDDTDQIIHYRQGASMIAVLPVAATSLALTES